MTATGRRRRNPLRALGTVAGGSIIGQGAVILAAPILTRLYSPDTFGILAIYSAAVAIGGAAACARYDQAILIPRSDAMAFVLLQACTWIAAGVSALLLAAVAAAHAWLPEALFHLGFYLIPLGVFLTGTLNALRMWCVRAGRYGPIGVSDGTRGLASAAGQVGAGMVIPSAGALIGATAAALLPAVLVLRAPVAGNKPVVRRRRRMVRLILGRFRRFPLIATPSTLINTAGQQIPSALFTAAFGGASGGFMLMAQRISLLPLAMVGRALSDVYVGYFRDIPPMAFQQRRALYRRTIARTFLFIGVPAGIGAFLLGAVLDTVLGESWAPTGTFMQILSPAIIAQATSSPLGPTLMVIERQDIHLQWDILRLLAVLGSVGGSYVLAGGALAAISLLAASTFCLYAGLAVWIDLALSRPSKTTGVD